jgi:hypothetical protein
MSDQVVERLDRLISLVSLAFAAEIEKARSQVRANPVSASVLDLASDWIGGGQLQKAVAAKTGKGQSTVRAKVPDLVAIGALVVRGSGPATEYKATGLI